MRNQYYVLPVLLIILICNLHKTQAQYYQWAKEYFEKNGMAINAIAVDSSGNSYMAGESRPNANTSAFFLVKVNGAGFQQWKINKTSQNGTRVVAQSITIDNSGNCYVTATVNPLPGSVVFNGLSVTAGAFLAKFSPSGLCLRLDSIGDGSAKFAVTSDNTGNVYLTNGIKTKKVDPNGIFIWENVSNGGSEINTDGNNKVYLLSSGSLKKLNTTGTFAWTFPSGGSKFATDKQGNCIIISNDSIFKIKTSGNIEWSNKALHGNAIALDNTGKIYLAIGNSLRKIESNGTSIIWSRNAQNAYFKVITTVNGNCFIGGEFDPVNETVICPFHFTRVGVSSPYQDNKGFITKLNQTNPIPFQANIYTPPLPGDRLCSGVYFQVPYFSALNSSSAFGVGNQFRAQLINPVSGDTVDIGKADSAFIPFSAASSSSCRIRVVSTNPVVIGDPNSPQLLTPDLTLEHLNATVSPAGIQALCPGQVVALHAAVSPSNYFYFWYKNSTSLSSGTGDSVKTVNTAGDYYYDVYTSDFNCSLRSPVVHVDAYANPIAPISAAGPLSFCAGDSVLLSTPLLTGFSYQWKLNSANIAGATLNSYPAKNTGNYKVKVANQAGCTTLSLVKSVMVNCKTSQEDNTLFQLFPQPFHDAFRVSVSNHGLITVKIYDIAARLLFEKVNFDPALELVYMTSQPAGIYQMQIKQGNNMQWVRLIKGN